MPVNQPLIICGIDLSIVNTGIAVWDGLRSCWWTRTIQPPTAEEECLDQRIDYVVGTVKKIIRLHDPEIIGLEGPAYNKPFVAYRLGMVMGALRIWLWQNQRPFIEISPTAVKKFATGSGKANKLNMIQAAANMGIPVNNHHEADAAFLALYIRQHYCDLVECGSPN